MSLKTLGFEIEKWVSWKERFGPAFADATYPLPDGWAKFLGAIHSRFNRHKSKAAGRYNERISQLDDRIEEELVPRLRASNVLFAKLAYEKTTNIILPEDARDPEKTRLYALARIPDFAQASHIASELGKPVYGLTDNDLRGVGLRGNVQTGVKRNVETFDNIFSAIEKKIEVILDYE